jgi:hypothetical protein
MTHTSPLNLLLMAATLGLSALACQSGGVGDPCVPEDEYRQDFNGYAITEVNVESKSFQCETRVCIVNHFQGRASCPYGQEQATIDPGSGHLSPDDPKRCRVPGTDGNHCISNNGMPPSSPTMCGGAGALNVDEITVPVESQRIERNAQDTVYCSCRCKGPDTTARYCECPSGYECSELVRELGIGAAQLAGSYCIKSGTAYNPQNPPGPDTCATLAAAHQTRSSNGRFSVADVCGPANQNP